MAVHACAFCRCHCTLPVLLSCLVSTCNDEVSGVQMDDPSIFPQHYGERFPPCFQDVICAIFKRLFRVYAHIYHSHFKYVCALKEEAHLNTCFKHFMYFTEVCSLLSPCVLSSFLSWMETAMFVCPTKMAAGPQVGHGMMAMVPHGRVAKFKRLLAAARPQAPAAAELMHESCCQE